MGTLWCMLEIAGAPGGRERWKMRLQGLRIALRSSDFALREMRATEGDRVGLEVWRRVGDRAWQAEVYVQV